MNGSLPEKISDGIRHINEWIASAGAPTGDNVHEMLAGITLDFGLVLFIVSGGAAGIASAPP